MHIKKIPRLRFHADTSIGDSFDLIKKIEGLVDTEKKEEEKINELHE
jgi:ribosome-binding factor A